MTDFFNTLPVKLRRELFILAHMRLRGKTYTEIADKHGMTTWFVSACARGIYRMSDKCRKAFEKDLKISLAAFDDPKEKFPRDR